MEGAPIENGVVLIRDGQIERVGPAGTVAIPDGYRVLDAAVVTPGLVDARGTVGLSGILNQPQDQDHLDTSDADPARTPRHRRVRSDGRPRGVGARLRRDDGAGRPIAGRAGGGADGDLQDARADRRGGPCRRRADGGVHARHGLPGQLRLAGDAFEGDRDAADGADGGAALRRGAWRTRTRRSGPRATCGRKRSPACSPARPPRSSPRTAPTTSSRRSASPRSSTCG